VTDSRDTPPYTFTFKQDGASPDGTVGSEGGGDQQIRDGKVNGDRVTSWWSARLGRGK